MAKVSPGLVTVKAPERWAGSQEASRETPTKGPQAAGGGSEDERGSASRWQRMLWGGGGGIFFLESPKMRSLVGTGPSQESGQLG